MNGLSAFVETIKILKKKKVIEHNWNYGEKLISETNKLQKNLRYLNTLAYQELLVHQFLIV